MPLECIDKSAPAGRARAVAATAAACLAAALAVVASFGPAPASAATPPAPGMTCPPVNLWGYNQGSGQIVQLTPDGTEVSSAPAARTYGDIAWSADGSTLYGVEFNAPSPTLNTIDPATGAETDAVPITGMPAGVASALNGLASLPNGQLFATTAADNTLWTIDPATGVATQLPASFPFPVVGAGDAWALPDGDILVLGIIGSVTTVNRLRPDSTFTQVGTIATGIFAAAQSGGEIYLFAEDGRILKLEGTPPSTPSFDPLPVQTVAAAGGSWWGGTAIQDNGLCNLAPGTGYSVAKSALPSGPVTPGMVVTYRVQIANTGNVAYPAAAAGFVDHLNGVLDDAAVVPGSATANAGNVTVNGSKLSWIGPLAASGNPGSTVTVTYQVRVNGSRTGNGVLANTASPTGAGGSCAICTTTTSITYPAGGPPERPSPKPKPTPKRKSKPKPRLRLRKTVNDRRIRAGQTATFRLTVRNPSGRAVRKVRVCDRLPAGLVYAAARPSGRISNGAYCWTIKRLRARSARSLRLTVRSLPGATGRKVNRASASSPNARARAARARAALRVIAGQGAGGGVTG